MINNYRYLNITKQDLKTIFQKKAIEFANKEEKEKFKYFSIRNWYLIQDYDKLKPFSSYKEAERYMEDKSAFEGSKIIHKFVLLMK